MEIVNNRYQLSGGVDPLELAAQYGTPLYVYDSAIMKKKYDDFRKAFDVADLRINYACKALTNISVLKLFNKWGSGLDTVSIGEVKLGLKAGFTPEKIFFTPNGVGLDEFEEAVKLGVSITIDNISILEQFGQIHPEVPVCIRINPHIMAGYDHKTSVGHIDSKFGISFHQMPHVRRVVQNTGTKVIGLHMHTGSDILDPEVFLRGAEILFNIAHDFPDLKFLDFGSGFKVKYKEGDIHTDIAEIGAKISERFNEFCRENGRQLGLIFEPGKYLVSEAGFFLASVNVIKQTLSSVFAGLNTGLNHLIRPMFYEAHHDIINISNPEGTPRFYTVVGYICETDTFGVNRRINTIQEGDVLCFKNAGAYCYTMSSNYNSRLRPPEILVHEGKHYLIRERESFEDLLKGQHVIEI
ncbi:MAG: diaminopimelate decarboxylase [Saprospiraceae bacterium]|nr:diaminopimelate decarboxylase [Saprospiraceae bacterium]MCB9322553.1 diaminopimelate decarboxylase [Lewinellaceae bacterium]